MKIRTGTLQEIEDFVGQASLAVVGVSRTGKGFGNYALRELVESGRRVFPVHPEVDEIQGAPCYRSLAEIPESVGGVVVVVPPERAEAVVREAHGAGIQRVWLQQGGESNEAVQYARANSLTVIAGECVLMFLSKGHAIHRWHRGIRRFLGRTPA